VPTTSCGHAAEIAWEGWVFPSRQKGKYITGGMVNKQWIAARKAAGLPESQVLYCGRHDYGTYLLGKTGNLKAIIDSMGHADVKTAMRYQHPELEIVRQGLERTAHSAAHRRK